MPAGSHQRWSDEQQGGSEQLSSLRRPWRIAIDRGLGLGDGRSGEQCSLGRAVSMKFHGTVGGSAVLNVALSIHPIPPESWIGCLRPFWISIAANGYALALMRVASEVNRDNPTPARFPVGLELPGEACRVHGVLQQRLRPLAQGRDARDTSGTGRLDMWGDARGRQVEDASTVAHSPVVAKASTVPLALLMAFAVAWAALAIAPRYRADWMLENALVVVIVPLLVATYQRLRFSNASYVALFFFLLLHEVGAHYTYAEVPYDRWVHAWLGI